VGEVTPNSPADKAGLKEGDVISEFNGKKVSDSRNLRLMAAQTRPGTEAKLKVIRDGKEQTMTVRMGELPTERLTPTGRSTSGTEPAPKGDLSKGVEVGELDQRIREQFDIPENVNGAVVINVEPASPAAEAGLRPGDVILEVNRKRVNDAEQALELSRDAQNDRLLLRVWSRGGSRYIVLDPSK
jgi:serine protease Do